MPPMQGNRQAVTAIRRAFAAVDRARFIPDRIWPVALGPPLDRTDNPQEWADLVYSDESIVTQVDDGRSGGIGRPSSSSSSPAVMAEMLEALDARPGDRVLEIGTGTGYNAAVLTELVGGSGSVTTSEVDPVVADRARANLNTVDALAAVVTGDGQHGYAPGAPYDRVIATCSVTRIPSPWIAQAAEGAVIVAPWKPSAELPGGFLTRLTVEDGVAAGRFVGHTSFMMLRAHRWQGGAPHDLDGAPDVATRFKGDPREVVLDEDTGPALALTVPGWRGGIRVYEPGGDQYVWLSATTGPSWARLHGDGRVEQGGPRRLWDELIEAHRRWVGDDRPGVTDYGLSVDAAGAHRVWLGTPHGPSWTHRGRVALGGDGVA
ncbi:methyltransferase domain-containing protein [Streptomonospora salina]